MTRDALEQAIAELARTPTTLAHLVAEADDRRLDDLDREGWSARLLLAWFRDEEVLSLRPGLARMLTEPEPEVFVLERAAWLAGRHRSRDRKEQLLGDFALQRQATLAMLRALEERQLERRGRRQGSVITVAEYVGWWAEHDRARIAQLEAAVGETLGEVLERRRRMVEEWNERT